MNADDFYYAGHYLSEFGFIIVQFDESSGGFKDDGAGSELSFTQISQDYGRYRPSIYAKYDEPSTLPEIGICKEDGSEVSPDEYSNIMRWLSRTDFNDFKIVNDDWVNITFHGSFNITRKLHRGKTVGFVLKFKSDSPYGYGTELTETLSLSSSKTGSVYNMSDEMGVLYPSSVTVTCGSAGDLTLTNNAESRSTYVANCKSGEVLTFIGEQRIIQTSDSSHTTIMDDFNYNFPRLFSDYDNRSNVFSASIPCTVVIKYSPAYKVVV